jgi:putative ATP-dependent endonuclease of OLD family
MKLKLLRLKNFRCFPGELIELNNYTSLLGPNNVGKSAILRAIDIFFRSSPKNIPVTTDDFYLKKGDDSLEIALTFDDLTAAETEEFSHYARGGKLQFMIRSQLTEGGVQSQIHGIRIGRAELKPYFESKNATEKKAFYNMLIGQGLELAKWTKEEDGDANIAALDASVTCH